MSSSSNSSKKIFISYSHKDFRHLERLQVHLADYVRKKLIDVWDDTKIAPGAKWLEEIQKAIETANIAVLLISADFLASQFIAENELPPLLQAAQAKGTIILPIIVSPCSYKHSKLSEFQAVNSPSKTLTKMNKHEKEELWNKVANIIRDATFSQKIDENELIENAKTGISMNSFFKTFLQKDLDEKDQFFNRYSQRVSRKYPALFIILIDQSGSMAEQIERLGQTKADIAATALNTIIYKVINNSGFDEFTTEVRDCAYISVLGYSDKVNPLLSNTEKPVSISTLAKSPKGRVTIARQIVKDTVTQVIHEQRPFWITPYAKGNGDMTRAFATAREIVMKWLPDHEKGVPPVIINITDALDSGPGDLLAVTHQIQQMRTDDGNVLICNCHLSKDFGHRATFPVTSSEIQELKYFALKLFEMSSLIPERLRERAVVLMRKPIQEDARCFVYNADPSILVNFLNWGTLANLP